MFGKPGLRAQGDAGVTVEAVPWAKKVSGGRWLTCVLASRRCSRQFRCLLRQHPLSHERSGRSSATDGDFTYRCNYREILLILQSIHADMLHRTRPVCCTLRKYIAERLALRVQDGVGARTTVVPCAR